MPSIAHLVLGGVFGICLYYMSSGKFSKHHVFIFFLNNYFGPDLGWATGLGHYTHTLLGWFFFAFALAIFYHYFTRFTIKTEGVGKIEFIDLEKPKLSYIDTFYVVLAGGILHNYLDSTMNHGGRFYILPQLPNGFEGLTLTFEDLIQLFQGGIFEANVVISLVIGIIFILGFIYVFTWFIKDISIKSGLFVLIHIILFMLYFYLVGGLSTGEHGDAGAIIYISLYWLPVIILLTLSTKPNRFKLINKHPIEKSRSTLGLRISKILYLLLGIMMILGGILLIFSNQIILNALIERDLIPAAYQAGFINALILISIIIMGIGGLIVFIYFKIKDDESHHKNLFVISLWLYTIGLIGIILGVLGILLNELLVTIISSVYGILYNYVTFEEAVLIVSIFGILVLILGLLNMILAVGLTSKNHTAWKFSIYYHIVLAWTIVGLTICCALNEKGVKQVILRE